MPDGSALKLILSNLDAQEEALTAMFLGTQSTSTEVVTLTYMPKADVTDEVIARLSRTEGIVDADDLRGVPVYISVDVTSRGKMPVNDKGETKAMPKGGVAYCIPGSEWSTVWIRHCSHRRKHRRTLFLIQSQAESVRSAP